MSVCRYLARDRRTCSGHCVFMHITVNCNNQTECHQEYSGKQEGTIMAIINITDAEARLLVELLDLAADSFSNHGCNDFDLTKSAPDLEDRRALMKSYNDYNGFPEDFEDDELRGSQYELGNRSEEHTSELQSPCNLVCRLLLETNKHI